MARRAFTAAKNQDRCKADIRLRDGSGAQCMRQGKVNGFCLQHSKSTVREVYLCPACELIFDTEKQARNCSGCHLNPYYACPICWNVKRDKEAADRCCGPRT